jgi:PTS system fructose-specific IIC component
VKIAELLKEGLVVTGFAARDKAETLPKLLDIVGERLTPEHRSLVLDALIARERVASTGLDNGIAMPHARVDIPGDVVVALAISPAGIPFQSADGKPARILALLVIPTSQMQKGIKLLADAARLLSYEEVREGLLRARTPREALEVLRAHES